MYERGLLCDEDIHADLADIVVGKKSGRGSDEQFVYFNAIGLSFADVSGANWLMSRAEARGLGRRFDFSM